MISKIFISCIVLKNEFSAFMRVNITQLIPVDYVSSGLLLTWYMS